MKKVIILSLVALFAISFNADAQNCNQGKKLAQKTWQKFNKPWKVNINPIAYATGVKAIKTGWNAIAANSGAAIGPRFLDTDGSKQTGSVSGQTKRTFVTPPSFNKKMTITINKYQGKAETGVIICSHDEQGRTKTLREYTFKKDKNGKVKKFELNNVKGKIISVAIRNRSVANKFKYRVTAK